MKKFIVFFILCIFLFTASLFKQEFDFSIYDNLNVQIFTSSKQIEDYGSVRVVDNGAGQIINCTYNDYKVLSSQLHDVSGVTFIFTGNKSTYEDCLDKLNVKVVQSGESDFLGYTNYFNGGVKAYDKKVNVQGYFDGEKIFIGTPLLLGSY